MTTVCQPMSRRSSASRSLANRAVMESLENRQMFSLLGVIPGLPTTSITGPDGALTYSASSHSFDAVGAPVAMLLSISPFNVTPVGAPSSFDLHITVDNAGNASSGTLASDLVLTGSVDTTGDGVADYSGVLLTGKIVAMGSEDSGTNDNFDFRLTVTGGQLATPYFSGKDIGLLLTTENSTFDGTFATDFTALVKGTMGPIPSSGNLPISISGYKYQDQTGNGLTADDAAHPISGVTIQLYLDSNHNGTAETSELVATQQTTATGAYAFTGLAQGTYIVKEVAQAGYVETAPASGQYVVNAAAGAYTALNFDNYKCGGCCCCCGTKTLTTATSSLEGTVFLDLDNDGKQDCGEYGISGVKITLTGTDLLGNQVTRTLTTDCSGHYNFRGLIAGNYTLTETQPSGYTDGKDHVGTLGGTLANDTITNITVPPCADGDCYNFGEIKATHVCGNTGHGGCRVTFDGCDDKGRRVCYTTTTDCHGNFDFGDVRGGCYTIRECDSRGRDTGYGKSCNVSWSDRDHGYSFCGFNSCVASSWSDWFKNCW